MKNPILPNRALYICDEQCGSTCDGCYLADGKYKYTKNVLHAKNGPVVNIREWNTRFEVKDIKAVLYYVEKIDEQSTDGT